MVQELYDTREVLLGRDDKVTGVRINVVSYIDPSADAGGGGMILRSLVAGGELRGHHFHFCHMYPKARLDIDSRASLWLLVDLWNHPWHWKRPWRMVQRLLPWTGISRYRKVIDDACDSGRVVHLDSAYVDICDEPYLPCNGRRHGDTCEYKMKVAAHRPCIWNQTARIYKSAALNAFLSPLHHQVVEGMLGSDTVGDRFIIRPTVDSALFRPSANEGERTLNKLFVGAFVEAKGSREIMARWPAGEVNVVGPSTPDAENYPGYCGPLPYAEMPRIMRNARTFVFRPRWPEPQGRVVVEAALSGCALDVNENVGALSFDLPPSDPSLSDGAVEEFWSRLESLAGNIIG
jgi:glycosyltransferase involved in cell wall biosynthesis